MWLPDLVSAGFLSYTIDRYTHLSCSKFETRMCLLDSKTAVRALHCEDKNSRDCCPPPLNSPCQHLKHTKAEKAMFFAR